MTDLEIIRPIRIVFSFKNKEAQAPYAISITHHFLKINTKRKRILVYI